MSRLRLTLLLGVTALAIWLRVWGLAFGLPAVYNQDEVAIMSRALSFAQGDLNPRNFLYPTLYFYALFVWEGLAFLAGRLFGVFASASAFERSFFVDPSFIYLAGRALTVLTGVATVGATYLFAARLFGRAAGLVAALLLAVAPLAVRDAHYVKHDVPVTLLIVMTHVVLAGIVLRPATTRGRFDAGAWLLAGAVAGLAMSTHYYAIFLVAPIALAALAAPAATGMSPLARLSLAGGACVVAFFTGSPFLLVEPATAMQDIVQNQRIVVGRVTDTSGALGSAGFYLSWLANDAAGRLTGLVALAGLAAAVSAGWRRAGLVLAFPVVFLLFIANTYPASRYLNPVLPFVTTLAGGAVAWLLTRGGPFRIAALALTAAAAIDAGTASVRADAFFTETDTRTQALDWIERTIPAESSILVQPYSVPLRQSRAGLVEALTATLGSPDRASPKFAKALALDPYPAPAYRTIFLGAGGLDPDKIYIPASAFDAAHDVSPLRARAVTYVVLKRYNVADPSLSSLQAALTREGHLLATFSPYRAGLDPARAAVVAPFLHNTDARIDAALERPGPVIDVWTID